MKQKSTIAGLGVPLSRLISKTFSVNKGTIGTIPLTIPNLGGCEKPYKVNMLNFHNKVNIRSQVGRSKGTMMKEIELHSGILEGLAIFEKVNYQYISVVALQSKMRIWWML